MNWAEMVVVIVIVATIGSVLKARWGIVEDKDGNEVHVGNGAAAAENEALRRELAALKERLHVLERLATEDTAARRLDQEIERLRDRT